MTRSKLITAAATFAVAATPAIASAHGPASDHGHHHDRGVDHVRGTVASFTDGVLTITKADGTTVSARVTSKTRIGCKVATPVGAVARHGSDQRTTTTDRSGSDAQDNQSRDDSTDQPTSAHEQSDDNGQGDDDTQDHGNDRVTATGRHGKVGGRGDQVRHRRCGTTDLTTGATVRKADLRGTGDAAVWRKVEISQ